jgi:MFS family permease
MRWLSLSASLALEAVAGSPYAFGLWSSDMKRKLGLTQNDIATIGSIGNIGLYGSVFSGMVYDRYGPRVCSVLGAFFSLLGYGLLYLAVSGQSAASVGLLVLYTVMWNHGAGWLDTAAVATSARNFAENRGMALGLIKSFFGLSGAILALIYKCFFNTRGDRFLGFCAVYIAAVGLIAGLFTTLVKRKPVDAAAPSPHAKGGHVPLQDATAADAEDAASGVELSPLDRGLQCCMRACRMALCGPVLRRGSVIGAMLPFEVTKMKLGFVAVLCLCGYIATVTVMQNLGTVQPSPLLALGVLPFVALISMVALPLNQTTGAAGVAAGPKPPKRGADFDLSRPLLSDDSATASEGSESVHTVLPASPAPPAASAVAIASPAAESGAPLLEAILSLDFWLIFSANCIGTGCGLTVINNVANIAPAMRGAANSQDMFLVALSVANCIGRMGLGFLPDITSKRMFRPMWLAVVLASMGGAMAVMAIAVGEDLNTGLGKGLLGLGVAWTGASYGGFFTLTPALLAERFGSRSFGSVYSISGLGSALSSYIFSVILAADVYNRHSTDGGRTCIGTDCYRTTFIVLAALCGLAILLAFVIRHRTRLLYRDSSVTGRALSYSEFAAFTRASPLATYLQGFCIRRNVRFCRNLIANEEDWTTAETGKSKESSGDAIGRPLFSASVSSGNSGSSSPGTTSIPSSLQGTHSSSSTEDRLPRRGSGGGGVTMSLPRLPAQAHASNSSSGVQGNGNDAAHGASIHQSMSLNVSSVNSSGASAGEAGTFSHPVAANATGNFYGGNTTEAPSSLSVFNGMDVSAMDSLEVSALSLAAQNTTTNNNLSVMIPEMKVSGKQTSSKSARKAVISANGTLTIPSGTLSLPSQPAGPLATAAFDGDDESYYG